MSASPKDVLFTAVFGFIVGSFSMAYGGLLIGSKWKQDTEAWRRESVRRGAAKWVLDPATGKTEWRWLDAPIQPPTAKKEQPADR